MGTIPAAAEVRIAKSIGYRIIAKKSVRAILWLIVLAAVVYVFIASSMTRYVATDLGTMKIVSPNFTGGNAQKGTVVAIDPMGGHDGSILKNLKTTITPHGGILVAEIVEGPYGVPDWSDYKLKMDEERVLSNEYVIKCLEGCNGNIDYGVVHAEQIMGIPVR